MTSKAMLAAITAALLVALASPSEARPKQAQESVQCEIDFEGNRTCQGAVNSMSARPKGESGTQIIGGRPPGCPRKFCGCEASLYVFGKIVPDLNLAANWIRKFPRTSPAPGMAAARPGHVMVLVSHVSGNDWLVHDGNSGRGLTRRHVRDISRFVVVNPHGSFASR